MTVFDKFAKDFTNKKVLIFGLGIQGRGLGDALIFSKIGANLTITDQKSPTQLSSAINQLPRENIKFSLGGHKPEDVLSSDVVIRNASIPWNHPLLNLAREHQIPIETDETLFFKYSRPKKVIGVTGTRGKTTTTTLIHLILTQAGLKPILAGNLVETPSLQLLETFNIDSWYVFEFSSWQLQPFHNLKYSPPLSVVTNIYEDHLLDRSFTEYINDKTSIFRYQNSSDTVFLNHSNPHTNSMSNLVHGKVIWFDQMALPADFTTQLPGLHNLLNIKASIAVARSLGITDQIIFSTISQFRGVPFRLQLIGSINQVKIINDTTSTTPVASITALETYPNTILICGGTTKQLPVKELVSAINSKAKAVILLSGSGTDQIKPLIDPKLIVGEYDQLSECLNMALSTANSQDYILFSPGFTSFGLFANEFDRGHQFNSLVSKHPKFIPV